MGKQLASALIVTLVVVVSIGLLLLSSLELSPEEEPNLFGLPSWAFWAARILAIFIIVYSFTWSSNHRRSTEARRRKKTSENS